MKKKLLIIISDELEEYKKFFSSVQKRDIFNIRIIPYKSVFSQPIENTLKELRYQNVILAFHAPLFGKFGKDLTNYFKKLYNPTVNNFLFLCQSPGDVENRDIISGSRYFYSLQSPEPDECNVLNFILYVTRVFSENTINARLYDYIIASFQGSIDKELLAKKNAEIQLLMKEVERKSQIDGLTNLYNRATIFKYLEQERNRTNRDLWRIKAIKESHNVNESECDFDPAGGFLDHYGVLSLMMIDVDNFKKINDAHGHLVGDEVLKTIGALLLDKDIFRDNDVPGRFGGEEFLVILPDTNVNNALGPAIRFTERLSQIEFFDSRGEGFKVSVSIGISQSSPSDNDNEDIVKRSDDALYYAKKNGRNRVVIYEKMLKL